MLGDMISHLRDDCGMPVQLLYLLFETPEEAEERRPDLGPQRLYAMNKGTYYAVTRQWFIAQTARDWARGCAQTRQWAADKLVEKYFGDKKNKLLTRDQIRRKALRLGDDPEQMVTEHYRPPRNGAERMLLGRECPWCCKVIKADGDEEQGGIWCEPVEPLLMSDEMRAHLAEEHPVNQLPAEGRRQLGELVKQAKEKDKARGEEIRCEIVEELVATGLVSEVQHCGPRRPGRVTHVRKLKCHVCNIAFTTGAGAMKLHMQGHERNDYTKVGQLCIPIRGYVDDEERRRREEYRPEQHALNGAGQYFWGSDARLFRVDVPQDARHVDPVTGEKGIACRVCGDKVYPYDERLHKLRARSSKVSKMRKHEEACRRRKEAAEAEAAKKRKKQQEEASAAAAKKRKIARDRKEKP
eukprot:g9788.t1